MPVTKRVLVRYKVKEEKAEENKQLIQAVFKELEATQPPGIRYASFILPDGLSFIHIASVETADGKNPLNLLTAFGIFSAGIKERCEEPPVAVEINEIGSYQLF
jgi:hypothetical protein